MPYIDVDICIITNIERQIVIYIKDNLNHRDIVLYVGVDAFLSIQSQKTHRVILDIGVHVSY